MFAFASLTRGSSHYGLKDELKLGGRSRTVTLALNDVEAIQNKEMANQQFEDDMYWHPETRSLWVSSTESVSETKRSQQSHITWALSGEITACQYEWNTCESECLLSETIPTEIQLVLFQVRCLWTKME